MILLPEKPASDLAGFSFLWLVKSSEFLNGCRMSDDVKLNIDTQSAINALKALDAQIDQVAHTSRNLDRSSLNAFKQQLAKLGANDTLKSVQELGQSLSKSLGSIPESTFKGLSANMKNQLEKAFGEIRKTIASEQNRLDREMQGTVERTRSFLLKQNADAVALANKTKSAYTPISFNSLGDSQWQLRPGATRYTTSAGERSTKQYLLEEASSLAASTAAWDKYQRGLQATKNAEIDLAFKAKERADVYTGTTATQAFKAQEDAVKAQNRALGQRAANEIASHTAQLDAIASNTAATTKAEAAKNAALVKAEKLKNDQIEAAYASHRSNKAAVEASWNKAETAAAERKQTEEKALWKVHETEARNAHKAALAQELKDYETFLAEITKLRWKARQMQVTAAMNNPVGDFQRYNFSTGLKGAYVPLTPTEKSASFGKVGGAGGFAADGPWTSYNARLVKERADREAEKAAAGGGGKQPPNDFFKKLAMDGNDAHSAMRGLASGFNLLWLTWGNLAPLFAGAVISNSFMTTAKAGMEFGHTLQIIATLGENSKQAMASLTDEAVRLGNSGPIGPLKIAEAMKVLSLAGLKADEIVAVTKDVMNFSIAGTTDLKTAADTLVSVSTAFGMGAAGFGTVGDVIAKAAAESKTSVESFSAAMKTASVINAQYGVSLTDTATAIALMSQLGIEGTAAGTALRNMYADLSGRSAQVEKIIKQFGLTMRDTTTGGFKPLIQVVAELDGKLKQLTPIGQKNLIQALLGERGAKPIVEALREFNIATTTMNKDASNMLADINKKIVDNYGFSAVSAAELAQTTKSQFESVKATLETSMVQAFKQMEPALRLIFEGMRKAFASPEFISGLGDLVRGVTTFGQVVVENIGTVTKLIEIMLWLKTATVLTAAASEGAAAISMMFAKSKATTAAAVTTETVALEANTVAQTANNASKIPVAGRIGALGRAVSTLNTAVIIGTMAWLGYEWWVEKSSQTAKKAEDQYNNNIVKYLEDEAERLKKLNDLRATGLTLSEAQDRLDADKAKRDATALHSAAIAEASIRVNKANAEVSKYQAQLADPNTEMKGFAKKGLASALVEQASANQALTQAGMYLLQTEARVDTARQKVVDERKRAADQDAKDLKARQDAAAKFGSMNFNAHTGVIGGSHTNLLSAVMSRGSNELSTLKTAMSDRLAIVEAERNADLMSLGQTEVAKFKIIQQYENDSQMVIRKNFDDLATAINKAHDEVNKSGMKPEQMVEAHKKIVEQAITDYATLNKEQANLYEEAAKRRAQLSQQLDRETRTHISALEKWIATTNAEAAAETKLQATRDAMGRMKPWDAAEMEARIATEAKWNSKLYDTEKSLRDATDAAERFALVWAETADPNAFKEFSDAVDRVLRLQKALDSAKSSAAKAVGQAGANARQKSLNDEFDKFTKDIATNLEDAISTAVFDGGAAGGKKLRSYLEELLIRKPFKMVLDAAFNSMFGLDGKGGGGDWLKKLFSLTTGTPTTALSSSTGFFNDAGGYELAGSLGFAGGGTTPNNSLMRVNENGMEMLSVGGKDYLMTGAQRGEITPASRVGGITITNAPVIQIDSRTDQAQVYALVDRAVKAGNAKLVDDLKQARVL